MNDLLIKLATFLKSSAPNHAVTLTFDFDDDPERELESPLITVFPDEMVACFEECDLPDTKALLGF